MSGPDLSSVLGALTPAQQDAIRALIAQEAAKNAPPPPKELTPAEKADLLLSQAQSIFTGENTGFTAAAVVFYHRVLQLLENILAAVYPPVQETAVATDTATATESTTVASETGAV